MFVLEEDLEESIDDEESSNEPVDDVSSEYFETIEAGGDSLLTSFNEAEEVIPQTETHRRLTPSVTLLPTGQLVFSRAFDVFLGKSKTEPLGTQNNLLFKWGTYDRIDQSVVGYKIQIEGESSSIFDSNLKTLKESWDKDPDYFKEFDKYFKKDDTSIQKRYIPVFRPPKALFIQFLDKEVKFRSLSLSSKWPKNILSVRSILEPITKRINAGDYDERLSMHTTSYKNDSVEEKVWLEKLTVVPRKSEKYVFTGDSLILSEVDKTCALVFRDGIMNSIGDSNPEITFKESMIPFDRKDLDDIPF